jgi:cyanophycinase
VILHVLPQGARFDLTTRRLLPYDVPVDALEAAEIAEAGLDLRQMARDIAAGDASPSVLRRRLLRRSRPDSAATQDGDHR